MAQQAGYKTYWAGKTQMAGDLRRFGFDQGCFTPGSLADRDNPHTEVLAEGVQSFLGGPAGFISGAQAFLERRPADKPFCLSLACNLPHGSSTGTMELLPSDPELYRTTYRDRLDELALPVTYVARQDIKQPKLPPNVLYTQYRQHGYSYVDTPATMKERMIRKFQTITGIYRMVGESRDTLRGAGLADNTVIVFSSDHGIMNGEYGLGGKALNYETCLRVPMIMMDPRVSRSQQGQRSLALVQSINVGPTLLDYAEVEIPPQMQGQSLRPIIEGRVARVREFSFAENLWANYFGNPRIESVRDADWKYIRYFKNDRAQFADVTKDTLYEVRHGQITKYAAWLTASINGEAPVYEELYHLASDPGETVNLVDRPLYSDRLATLRSECQRLVTFAKGAVDMPPSTTVLPRKEPRKHKRS